MNVSMMKLFLLATCAMMATVVQGEDEGPGELTPEEMAILEQVEQIYGPNDACSVCGVGKQVTNRGADILDISFIPGIRDLFGDNGITQAIRLFGNIIGLDLSNFPQNIQCGALEIAGTAGYLNANFCNEFVSTIVNANGNPCGCQENPVCYTCLSPNWEVSNPDVIPGISQWTNKTCGQWQADGLNERIQPFNCNLVKLSTIADCICIPKDLANSGAGGFLGGLFSGGGGCFSSDNIIEVMDYDTKQISMMYMDSLQIGDYVRVDNTGNKQNDFSMVYSFAHYETSKPTQFVQIKWSVDNQDDTSTSDSPVAHQPSTTFALEVTTNHYIHTIDPVSKKRVTVPAGELNVGDSIIVTLPMSTTMNGTHTEQEITQVVPISSIDRSARYGAYAPLTVTGNIVVSNVMASSFVALIDFQKDDISVWMEQQQNWMSQIFMAPLRIFCQWNTDYCKTNESYTEDGVATWAVGLVQAVTWMNAQHPIVQKLLFGTLFLVLSLIRVMATTSFWMVLGLGSGYLWKSSKTDNMRVVNNMNNAATAVPSKKTL